MSAAPLFHGTRRPFARGGVLLPRSVHGGPGTTAPLVPGRTEPADARDWVYLTGDLLLAWVYAWHAPGRGAPRVLTVSPHGAVEADPEHSAAADAVRTRWGTVTAVATVPLLSEADARAGWTMTRA